MASEDFRPLVAAALARGDKTVVIPPGTYRLAPDGGGKCVWSVERARDVEIVAEGVTLGSTRLTRTVAFNGCAGVTLRGLTVDYEPLPFTQGTVVAVDGASGWIDVKLHAGYPRQPYSRIDVIDPVTRYRKRGMPFLWGTKAEMRGEDVVRVTLGGIGRTAAAGIDGLVIRGNTIRRAGWFCPAPWSSQAGAVSVTAGGGARQLRAAGVFANLRIEDNVFEDCVGPNVVVSSARGVRVRGNRFERPHHGKPNDTGASYGIAGDAVIWIAESEDVDVGVNTVNDPGPFLGNVVAGGVPRE